VRRTHSGFAGKAIGSIAAEGAWFALKSPNGYIDAKIARLLQVKAILTAEKTKPEPGRASSKPAKKAARTMKRTMSAEGRARIAAAQKARWA
jgi:hypothetical protein